MGLFLLFSPLIFLSYELSKRKVLPKDFYNFGKGFIVYLVNMLILYLLKKVFHLHYQPVPLFLYVFTLRYLVPQIVLLLFFFLLVRRDSYYGVKGEWISDFVVFSIGFYFFDAIVHFLAEYNRHDPFVLFAFPLGRLLAIAVTAMLFVLISNYRELKFWILMIFFYILAFMILALPEVLYDLSYFLSSFVLSGILFVIGMGIFVLKGDRV